MPSIGLILVITFWSSTSCSYFIPSHLIWTLVGHGFVLVSFFATVLLYTLHIPPAEPSISAMTSSAIVAWSTGRGRTTGALGLMAVQPQVKQPRTNTFPPPRLVQGHCRAPNTDDADADNCARPGVAEVSDRARYVGGRGRASVLRGACRTVSVHDRKRCSIAWSGKRWATFCARRFRPRVSRFEAAPSSRRAVAVS